MGELGTISFISTLIPHIENNMSSSKTTPYNQIEYMENFNDPDVKSFIENAEASDVQILPVEYIPSDTNSSALAEIKPGDDLRSSIDTITEMYSEFGKMYGIDMKFNIESVSSNFKSIIDPQASKVFELYLAEGFSRFKLSIIQKIMIAISTLVDRITAKEILETDNVELSVGLLDKLFSYMEQVTNIHRELKVDSADLMLKNAAKDINSGEEGEGGSKKGMDSVQMMAVLRQLQKTTVKGPLES